MHAKGWRNLCHQLITGLFTFYSSGTNRNTGFRAHHVHRSVPDAYSQRTQTAIPHRAGIHFVRVFDLHSVRVPEKKAVHRR